LKETKTFSEEIGGKNGDSDAVFKRRPLENYGKDL
jgi:hypothetical protein